MIDQAISIFVDPVVFANFMNFNTFTNLMAISQAFILYEEVLTRTLSLLNFYELIGFDVVPSNPYNDVEPNSVLASISDFQNRARLVRHYCVNPWQLDSDEK